MAVGNRAKRRFVYSTDDTVYHKIKNNPAKRIEKFHSYLLLFLPMRSNTPAKVSRTVHILSAAHKNMLSRQRGSVVLSGNICESIIFF